MLKSICFALAYITIGFLICTIIISSLDYTNITFINIIISSLLALTAAGSLIAASMSAKTAQQSFIYMTSLDQPIIELSEWHVFIFGEPITHRFNFTLNIISKEPIILNNVHLTFFNLQFKKEYSTERFFDIELMPNKEFPSGMECKIIGEKLQEESVNLDIEEEVEKAELKYAYIGLFQIKYKRKIEIKRQLEKKIALYYFFAGRKYRDLYVDDLNRLKNKIPPNFRKKLYEYYNIL